MLDTGNTKGYKRVSLVQKRTIGTSGKVDILMESSWSAFIYIHTPPVPGSLTSAIPSRIN